MHPLHMKEVMELKVKSEVESVRNSVILLEKASVAALRTEYEVSWIYSVRYTISLIPRLPTFFDFVKEKGKPEKTYHISDGRVDR